MFGWSCARSHREGGGFCRPLLHGLQPGLGSLTGIVSHSQNNNVLFNVGVAFFN